MARDKHNRKQNSSKLSTKTPTSPVLAALAEVKSLEAELADLREQKATEISETEMRAEDYAWTADEEAAAMAEINDYWLPKIRYGVQKVQDARLRLKQAKADDRRAFAKAEVPAWKAALAGLKG